MHLRPQHLADLSALCEHDTVAEEIYIHAWHVLVQKTTQRIHMTMTGRNPTVQVGCHTMQIAHASTCDLAHVCTHIHDHINHMYLQLDAAIPANLS